MTNFAQILPANVGGDLCLAYNDQSAMLASAWLTMLVLCLVLGILLFVLRKRKYSLLFFAYFAVLLVARLFNPANDCGHGGLFEFSESGLIMFGIFLFVILVTFILAIISIVISRKRAAKQ